ncbi:T9SS type A sorting domain-containing protein [Ferruginibacter lapsinanis]|uniref:T9SS type A sorting domain-containing protein n=1 Tax=Ferruginibacter lapsinanis TaxID=563172 RepID=UPI001E3BB732|nr:T9SS type A sorting domain-containing protein [Ferruginibacter lapsinanis]UEG49997.1 T9SS type A sorting domain-containing protein [Ferruginibacter lapsinanis]
MMIRNLLLVVLILIFFITPHDTHAEGRGSSAGNPLFGAAAQEGIIALYGYAQAGEKIDFRIERTRSAGISTDGSWTIKIFSPLGLVDKFLLNSSIIGTTCTMPKITITSTTAGIWTLLAIPTSNANNDAVSFDLTVYTSANSPLTGRVYTYSLHGLDQSSPLEANFTLYFLNPDGYQYSGLYKGLNGLNYTIVSDNFGVRTSGNSCISSYKSVSYSGKWSNLGPDSAVCGARNKIFFNAFNAALPASSVRFNTTTGIGQITEALIFTPLTPTLSAATFVRTGSCIQQGNVYFSTNNFYGSVYVAFDVNGNGIFTDSADRTDTVFSTGANSIYFNGLDRYGKIIPISQAINIKVSIDKVGETHFVMSDIEIFGGIEVTRLNGPGSPNKTIYWDDTNLLSASNCSLTSIVDGRAGVNSTGGVHGWNQCGTASPPSSGGSTNNATPNLGAWGNQRLIDNWTYLLPTGVTYTTNVPAIHLPDFGDLPTGWPIAAANTKGQDTNGDCVIDNNDVGNTTSVWAGAGVDFESAPKNSAINATSDNYDDGMSFPPGSVNRGSKYTYIPNINSNASNKTIYYALWFDWNNNGNFSDDVDCYGNPAFYTGNGNTPVAGGITSIPVSVCVPTDAIEPGGVSVGDYKVRLIVSDSAISFSQYNYFFSNGEVEDYQLPLVILPVTFGAISTKEKNCTTVLSFETIYEQRNSSFEIERSNDGYIWRSIEKITTSSNSNTVKKYQYTDVNILDEPTFYRIKQTAINGNIQYSKTVSITPTCKEHISNITSYPNPVNDKLIITTSGNLQNAVIILTNSIGQTVLYQKNNINVYTKIETSKLLRGLYKIRVIQNGKIIYQNKFIKL